MAYIQDEYYFPGSIENEIKWFGLYGAKGEHRGPKKKKTPEAIKRQNQWQRQKNMRRAIKNNFVKGDYWCTYLYPKGTRKALKDIQEDMHKYQRVLRKEYKKRGHPFKWVNRIEIGKLGGAHVHMLSNQIPGARMDMIMQDTWHTITGGRINFEPFQGGADDAENVGNYLTKALKDEQIEKCKELGLNPNDYVKISRSRNLEKPEHIRKEYSHWTMKRVIEEQMPKPREGFYIVKESVRFCSNIYTGMTHLYYTEAKLEGGGSP